VTGPGSALQPAATIAEAAPDARPRERLLAGGARSLSDAELVAVVLGTGRPGVSALDLAGELLGKAGGLSGLAGACALRLRSIGVGRAKVAAVLAAAEIACRMAASRVPEREPLSRPAAIARYVDLRYGHLGHEVLGALYVTVRHQLLGERELYRGTMTRAAVEPRAVLCEGLLRGAAAVILYHTHPSGDPTPSREDVLFTRRMARAGEVVGLQLVDHLVVGAGGRWVSLKERGEW
jgi:DNA repair protein RadC